MLVFIGHIRWHVDCFRDKPLDGLHGTGLPCHDCQLLKGIVTLTGYLGPPAKERVAAALAASSSASAAKVEEAGDASVLG
eukprot:238822-Amphidinium_carterae.1